MSDDVHTHSDTVTDAAPATPGAGGAPDCTACGGPLPPDVWACPACGSAVLDATGLPVSGTRGEHRHHKQRHRMFRKRRRSRPPASHDRSAHRTLKLRLNPTTAVALVLGMLALLALTFFLGMVAARG